VCVCVYIYIYIYIYIYMAPLRTMLNAAREWLSKGARRGYF